MLEIKKLSDFIEFYTANKNIHCPFCDTKIPESYVNLYYCGFSLNKTGRIIINCPNDSNHKFVIEAIGD